MGRGSPLLRLAHEAEYRLVYQEGSRRVTDLLVMHVLRTETPGVRLGLSVSRRVGGAVVRNRLRRRLREAVRTFRKDIVGGADLVVTPRKPAVSASFAVLRESVRRALVAAGLLEPDGAS